MSADEGGAKEARSAQKFFKDAIAHCMEKDLSKFTALVEDYLKIHNGKVNFTDIFEGFKTEGKTLLHMAASGGSGDIVKFILSKADGAKRKTIANMADEKGFTPLMFATISESLECMEALVKEGASVDAANVDKARAIHFAAADGSIERIQCLVDAGADVGATSNAGTALHWAAGKGHVEAVRHLLSLGVDVNTPNATGLPAVFLAAVSGNDACTTLLVQQPGVDLGAILSDNLTLLHICAENGLLEAVRGISSHPTGSKCVNMFSADNLLPIQLAAISNYTEIVRVLQPLTTAHEQIHKEWTVEQILEHGGEWLAQWEVRHGKGAAAAGAAGAGASSAATSNIGSAEPTEPAANAADEKKSGEFKEKGNAAFVKKDYKTAVECYTEAIKLCGNNQTLWSNRSACYLAMGTDFAMHALRDAETCRQLAPQWPKACYRLACARLALNMYEDAAVAAFEGTKLDNDNKELRELLVKSVKMGQEAHKRQQEELEQKKKQAVIETVAANNTNRGGGGNI